LCDGLRPSTGATPEELPSFRKPLNTGRSSSTRAPLARCLAAQPIPMPWPWNRLQLPAEQPVSTEFYLSLALLLLRPPLTRGW
jgi:hypothetical protein